jgi:hypothetical protein
VEPLLRGGPAGPIPSRAAWLPALALALLAAAGPAQSDAERRAIVSVVRIADRAPHAAFTDLVRWRDALWCAFREGSGHVPGTNGVIRLIRSADGEDWRTAAVLDEEGVDLRDPKLSVHPDGRLMLLAGGSVYRGRDLVGAATRVAFSADGETFEALAPIELEAAIRTGRDWLWRVTWHGETAFGVVYQPGGDGTITRLLSSTDGVRWRTLGTWDLDGRPNETTLRFLPDGRMLALVRREGGDRSGRIGVAAPPYTAWSWAALPVPLGGPELIVVPDPEREPALLAITRQYGDPARTLVARVGLDGSFAPLLTLPSGGDTSYAGAVLDGDRLSISYYASHEGRTAIYLARLRLPPLLAPPK